MLRILPRLLKTTALVALPFTIGAMFDRAASEQQTTAIKSSIDSEILKGLAWRSIGPLRGGRSIAISGVKGRPREGYFGATGGGLWKTIDGGETWFRSRMARCTVHRSARLPSPNRIRTSSSSAWVNRAFAETSSLATASTNRPMRARPGRTSAFPLTQAISKIRIHPTNAQIVYVASFGRYGVPSEERGIFKSTDGGATWRRILFRDAKTGGVDIAIDPRQPECHLRRVVGGISRRIPDVERRRWQRPVQVHRRWRALVGDHAQPRPASRCRRQDRRRHLRG